MKATSFSDIALYLLMDKLKWSIIGDVSRKFPSFFGAGRIAGAKQSED
jgi:hypothetical protein